MDALLWELEGESADLEVGSPGLLGGTGREGTGRSLWEEQGPFQFPEVVGEQRIQISPSETFWYMLGSGLGLDLPCVCVLGEKELC